MKLRIEQSDLSRAVTRASRALPARPSVPVLAGLKLTATDGVLMLSAFDYEVSVAVTTQADVAGPGDVVVSGRLLADITAALPKGHLVDLSLDDARLTVSSGQARFDLHTLPLEEYPALPAPGEALGSVTGTQFAEVVARVAPCADRDATSGLTGVQITIGEGTLELTATDRYRFARARLDWQPALPGTGQSEDGPVTLYVPAAALTDAAKDLAETETVHLGCADGLFSLTAADYTLTTRMLKGGLPDYRTLIRDESAYTTVSDLLAGQLTAALKRVALVTSSKSQPVRLHLADSSATLEAGTSDDATAADRIDATLTGDPATVVVHAPYLAEAARACGGDTVQLLVHDPLKPVLVHVPGKRETYLQIVMPIRLH